MKAHPGGDVEIQIGVVHAVQPPQQRDFVKRHVLGIDRQIERQESEQRSHRQP